MFLRVPGIYTGNWVENEEQPGILKPTSMCRELAQNTVLGV